KKQDCEDHMTNTNDQLDDLDSDDLLEQELPDMTGLWSSGSAFDNRRTGGRANAQSLSAAFWVSWIEHKDYLGRLAMRWMSGNRADAEDLVSRACIKAHDRYLRDAHRIRNLRSWLARLLHNACMDEHRKRQVR